MGGNPVQVLRRELHRAEDRDRQVPQRVVAAGLQPALDRYERLLECDAVMIITGTVGLRATPSDGCAVRPVTRKVGW